MWLGGGTSHARGIVISRTWLGHVSTAHVYRAILPEKFGTKRPGNYFAVIMMNETLWSTTANV